MVGYFHIGPAQIFIAVLAIAFTFLFAIAVVTAGHGTAIGRVVTGTGKTADLDAFQHDRQGQYLPDPRYLFQPDKGRGQFHFLQYRYLNTDNLCRNQLPIAHNLIELGADALIGHHSHTIQPYEIYQTRRDPDRRAPIFYSLGNLVSWAGAAYRCLSMVAQLGVVKGQIGGETKTLVSNIDILPVLQVEHEANGISYLQLDALGDLVRSVRDERIRKFTEQAVPYADLVLGEHWREDNYIHHSQARHSL